MKSNSEYAALVPSSIHHKRLLLVMEALGPDSTRSTNIIWNFELRFVGFSEELGSSLETSELPSMKVWLISFGVTMPPAVASSPRMEEQIPRNIPLLEERVVVCSTDSLPRLGAKCSSKMLLPTFTTRPVDGSRGNGCDLIL